MAKTKVQKQGMLSAIEENLKKSKSVIFTVNSGINAETMVDLRKKLVANQSKYHVAKKTLLKKALSNLNIEIPESANLGGAVNVVFSIGDELSGPKTVNDIAKGSEKIKIIGGVFENKYISAEQVISLATMPTKQELYARFVCAINSPVSGFVNVLAGNMRNFVNVINAIKDKKEAPAS